MAVALRRVVVTKKAQSEAREILPEGTIRVAAEIAEMVGRLNADEFRFSQGRGAGRVDVYRVETGHISIWIKLKLETDPELGEEVVVISFHEYQ